MGGPASGEIDGFVAGDLDAYATARGVEIGLPLPDEYRAAIVENLDILRDHAEIVRAYLGRTADGDQPS